MLCHNRNPVIYAVWLYINFTFYSGFSLCGAGMSVVAPSVISLAGERLIDFVKICVQFFLHLFQVPVSPA